MNRFWLIADRIATSTELTAAGISRLRAVDLGRCEDLAQARERAVGRFGKNEAVIIAHNVRLACDSGRGACWGLTAKQISRLRDGRKITLEDALGGFSFAYSRFD